VKPHWLFPPGYTLRVKLTLTLLAMIAVLSAASGVYYYTVRVALINEANQKLYAAVSHTAATLDAFVETNLDQVQAAAQFPVLEQYLDMPPDQRQGSQEETIIAQTLAVLPQPWDQFNLTSYALLDTDGYNVADTVRANIGTDESDHYYFQQVLKSGRPYASPVEFAPVVGGVYMHFGCPVRRNNVGEVIGVLRMRFSISSLQNMLVRTRDLAGEGSHAIVLDENSLRLVDDGRSEMLFRPVVSLSRTEVQTLRGENRLPNWPEAQFTSTLSGFARGLRHAQDEPFFTAELYEDGVAYQVATVPMDTQPWTVAFAQPRATFLEPVEAQARRVLALAALLTLGVIVSGTWVARWLTGPISRLTVVAEQVTAGDLSVQAEVEAQDEIGVLARAFNNMTARLRGTLQDLEERVTDLARVNIELEAEIGERKQAEQALREAHVLLEQRVAERTRDLSIANAALRQHTDELETRNEELDAFAHTVAHDLQGPLGITIGYAALLADAYDDMPEDQIKTGLDAIEQAGHTMSRIIDELLLLASVRKAEVETMPLDMGSIVTAAIQRLVYEIEKAEAVIERCDNWPVAIGYAPWIEEVWTNYISNALKYGGSPPCVELGADRLPDGTIRFWARDNGPGLSEEEQARLFVPFARLNQVRAKGHGLGLSIVRRIMERLDGGFGVESTPDDGSTFYFILPAADEP
jgi:signal transduction histidine kinase